MNLQECVTQLICKLVFNCSNLFLQHQITDQLALVPLLPLMVAHLRLLGLQYVGVGDELIRLPANVFLLVLYWHTRSNRLAAISKGDFLSPLLSRFGGYRNVEGR